MAANIKGTGTCQWGVTGSIAAGRITDVTTGSEALIDQIETQDGAVDGVVIYDTKYTISGTVVLSSGGSAPATGDSLTYDGKSYLLTRVGKTQRHKGKATVQIEGETYAELSLGGGGGNGS